MENLKTKYDLGQVVYNAYCTNEGYYVKCEDCDGTGFWGVEGKSQKIGCHTCNKDERFYNTPGRIQKFKYFPGVQALTIGQIRVQIGYDPDVRYMCEESGVGSGTLWKEDSLTSDEEEARKASIKLAEFKNSGIDVRIEEIYVQQGGL